MHIGNTTYPHHYVRYDVCTLVDDYSTLAEINERKNHPNTSMNRYKVKKGLLVDLTVCTTCVEGRKE